jgi:hypothetical protein
VNKLETSSKIKAFAQKWVWLALFCAYALSVFVPWIPRSWSPPCNNSWALVLHEAFVERAVFGSDVVFTFGPFGFLYFGATPDTYLFTLLGCFSSIADSVWSLGSAAFKQSFI